MKYVLLFTLLFMSSPLFAEVKPLQEKLTVRTLILDSEKSSYKVTFLEKAAFYHADKKLVACLKQSQSERKAYVISFDPLSLKILSCEK